MFDFLKGSMDSMFGPKPAAPPSEQKKTPPLPGAKAAPPQGGEGLQPEAVEHASKVFGHFSDDKTDEPKPTFKPEEGKTVHPDGATTEGPPSARDLASKGKGGEAAPEEAATAAAAAKDTKTGAGKGIPDQDGIVDERPVANAPGTERRARDAVAGMPPDSQQQYVGLLTGAQNQAQRVMIERAVAAGRSMEEVEQLAQRMAGKSDQDIMASFTGAGVFQGFQQSCVPTSYQIAIAEMDPIAAIEMRDNPVDTIEDQRAALLQNGGAPTKRVDLNSSRNIPQRVKTAMAESPQLAATMQNPGQAPNGGDRLGIEATAMVGGDLHKQLEGAAGSKYEALTNDTYNFTKKGQGQFAEQAIPHERMLAALADGRPVLFGAGGHQQAIIGTVPGPNGPQYLIQDPMSGATSAIDPQLMGMMPSFTPSNIIVPEAPAANAGPAPQPAIDIPTAASLAPPPAAVAGAPAQAVAPPEAAQPAAAEEEEKKDPWYKRAWKGLFG